MLFGSGAPKIIYNSTTYNIDYVDVKVEYIDDIIENKSEITGERDFLVRGQHRNYELKIYIFKATDPLDYHSDLKTLFGNDVIFYRHRDGYPDRDSNNNSVLYKVIAFEDYYIDEVTKKDYVIMRLESKNYVDSSKSYI